MRKHNSFLTSIATALAIMFIVGLLFVSIPTPVVSHSQYVTASGTRQVVKRLWKGTFERKCVDGVYQMVLTGGNFEDVTVEETYSYTYEVEHEHSLSERLSQTLRDVGSLVEKLKFW